MKILGILVSLLGVGVSIYYEITTADPLNFRIFFQFVLLYGILMGLFFICEGNEDSKGIGR